MGNEFVPRYSEINAITNAQNAVVTFTENHDFVLNEIVSFRVTRDYGMVEMNNLHSKIIDLTLDTITTEIDTTNFSPFSVPGSTLGTTPPVCVPCCSGVNSGEYVPSYILNDAFDNRRT